MIAVGINSPQGEIMGDRGGIGRGFKKIVGHVRNLSTSKEKQTPPNTPRAAETVEKSGAKQLHRVTFKQGENVRVTSGSRNASRYADADRSRSPSPERPDDPPPMSPREEAEWLAKVLANLQPDAESETVEAELTSVIQGPASPRPQDPPIIIGRQPPDPRASIHLPELPVFSLEDESDEVPTIVVKQQPTSTSDTTTTTTNTTTTSSPDPTPVNLERPKRPAIAPLNLAKLQSTAEKSPDADAPRIGKARPSKARAEGTPRMGDRRTDSDQQEKAPTQAPKKMFTHKRTLTDRSTGPESGTPRIGDRTPRTPRVESHSGAPTLPRILKPDIDVPVVPMSPREKDDGSISRVQGSDKSREKPDNQ
jgi:hypothetical protein